MFKITVTRHRGGSAEVIASARQACWDHLVASAVRGGYRAKRSSDPNSGDLTRDGRVIGTWRIEEI